MKLNLFKQIPNQVTQNDNIVVNQKKEQKVNNFQLKDLLNIQINKQNEEINQDIPVIFASVVPQSSASKLQDQKKSESHIKKGINRFISKKKSKAQNFVQTFLQNMNIIDKEVNKSKIIYVTDKIQRVERLKNQEAQYIYPKTIIHHDSKYKHIWDIIILIGVMCVALITPFEIGFNIKVFNDFEYVLTALFIADVIVNLRTTYIDENKDEIVSNKLIIIKYCKSVNFYIDVLGSIPFSDFFSDSNSEIRLIKLLKILRLLRITRLLQLLQNEKLKYFGLFFKIIVVFIMILHWISCLWFFIADSDQKKILPTQNALKYKWQPVSYVQMYRGDALKQAATNFYDRNITSIETQYIYTFYCIVQLISGGDNNPVNYSEAFLSLVMVIFAQITIATMFGNMSLLIFKMNRESEIYNQNLDALNFQIAQNRIQSKTADKIITYFEHCWKKKKLFQPELCNFNDVSHTLQRECLLVIHQDSVTRVPLFSQLEIQEVLSIIQNLKTHVYMPSDLIIQKNTVMTEMHFITDGVIEELDASLEEELNEFKRNNPQLMGGMDSLLKSESDQLEHKSTDQIIFQLSSRQKPPDLELKKKVHIKGDFIGELCLYFLTLSDIDYQASSFVTTETLSRKDFKKLAQEYKGMNTRLKQGLNNYKEPRKLQNYKFMKDTPIFKNVQQNIIEEFYFQYSSFIYFQTFDIIIKQEQNVEGYYIILKGSVQVCIKEYLSPDQFESLDDHIYTIFEPKTIYLEDQDMYLKSIQILTPGDSFGIFNIGLKKSKYLSKFYYISRESSEILFIQNKNFNDYDKYQISDKDLEIIYKNDKNIDKTQMYLEIPTRKIDDDEKIKNKSEEVPTIIQGHILPLVFQEPFKESSIIKQKQISPQISPVMQQRFKIQLKKPVQNINQNLDSEQLKFEIDNLKQKKNDPPNTQEPIQKTTSEILIFQYIGIIKQMMADQQKKMTILRQKIIQQKKKQKSYLRYKRK